MHYICIGLFNDDDWLEKVEEIRGQYDSADKGDDDEPATKKQPAKKVVKKQEPEPEDDDENDSDEDDNDSEGDSDSDTDGDEFDDMERPELKKYIKDNGLDIVVKKSMSDDDIRDAIRAAQNNDDDDSDDDDDDEEESGGSSSSGKGGGISLADIRNKLAKK